jgi:hypothetical protein
VPGGGGIGKSLSGASLAALFVGSFTLSQTLATLRLMKNVELNVIAALAPGLGRADCARSTTKTVTVTTAAATTPAATANTDWAPITSVTNRARHLQAQFIGLVHAPSQPPHRGAGR